MVPTAVTQAVIDDVRVPITAWAARCGWDVTLDTAELTLIAVTSHPKIDATVTFHAELDQFPGIPPAWTCRTPDGQNIKSAYPAAGVAPGIPSSIFHPNGLICAHWNRFAYQGHGGPHNDWGELADWKTAGPGTAHADTLPDMLALLRLHLTYSPGMQS
jgi:hypothetical protein